MTPQEQGAELRAAWQELKAELIEVFRPVAEWLNRWSR